MAPGFSARFSFTRLMPLLVPCLAGWSVGFFLREVQAAVVPYETFLVIGFLAGPLGFVPPQVILIGSQAAVLLLWVIWSGLLSGRTGSRWTEALRRDAFSYVPLLLLPTIALAVDIRELHWLRWLIDPMLLCVIGAVCAWKVWQWADVPPSASTARDQSCRMWIWTMFLGSALVFACIGVLQYRAWNVSHVDTGAFEEMLWKTLHGQFLWANVYHNTVLAYHVQLNQLLLLPFYAVWPSMECLTILQAVMLASGVFPLWWLARRHWDDRIALCFPLLYLLQPSLHFANAELIYNTYRPETMIIPALLFGIHFLESDRYGRAMICAIIVLISREEMGLVLAATGVYIVCQKKRWLWGSCLAAFGVGYLLFCYYVVIPHFNIESPFPRLGVVQGLGASPSEIALSALKRPTTILGRFADPTNVLYLSYLVVPLGFFSLGQPSLSLVAAPMLLLAMVMTGGVQNSILFHYHYPQFALLMAAAPKGAAVIASWLAKQVRCQPWRAQKSVLAFALGTATAFTVIGSKTPLSLNCYWPRSSPFHYSGLYVRTPHVVVLEKLDKTVPRDSRVSASIFAATHFVHRGGCYLFPDHYEDADFIVVDVNTRWKKGTIERLRSWGEAGPNGFVPVFLEDGVFVFRRKTERPK
jgi:uncharacterized membrane protein